MIDRTTKLLLAVIALALLGLLVRPFWTAAPVQAQSSPPPQIVAAQNGSSSYVLVTHDGLVDLYHADGEWQLQRVGTQKLSAWLAGGKFDFGDFQVIEP
jgi:hypothetical protein